MEQNNNEEKNEKGFSESRRNIIKILASVPVLGTFAISLLSQKIYQGNDINRQRKLLKELGLTDGDTSKEAGTLSNNSGKVIRVGFIGFGERGKRLMKSAGFVYPDYWKDRINQFIDFGGLSYEDAKNKAENEKATFLSQESLDIEINGVCDLFDQRTELAVETSSNEINPRAGVVHKAAKRYKSYKDMLASDDIDAIVVATPDHWHAQITIDAAKVGKHVYCEKAPTNTEKEVYKVVDAVKKSGIVYQLGHQNHQSESHDKAQDIISKQIIGDINLIQISTNRNTPEGAWLRVIPPEANEKTIDWEQFQEPSQNKVPFSAERFMRWRLWWDYGTGLSGDLLSHEFAAVNQIVRMGIPNSVTASGGIYHYDENWSRNKEFGVTEKREVPDVFQVAMEYPDRKMSILYSATLANSHERGTIIMGNDGMMEAGDKLSISVDQNSVKYKKYIADGEMVPSEPLYTYSPNKKGVDGISSATEKYFANKGLMFTYKDGKKVDSTYLHIKDWLSAIRNGGTPKCNIDLAFEEAITCHMATKSYREKRTVKWDPKRRRIV